MATTDKATLLGWIVTRWKPTVAQFKAFAESYWHKDEKIPTSSIDGLDSIMNGVATEEYVSNSIVEYGRSVSELIAGLGAKSGIIDKTYSELTDMITAGTLSAGSLYKITDRGDRGIILRAVSASQLSRDGIRIMLCPATYASGADAYGNNWIGVWHSTKTATFNCLAIWNGLVWRNLTGEIGTVTDDIGNPLDSTNWQVIAKTSFANHEYVELVFGCSYDSYADHINRQWDDKGNVITVMNSTSDDCSLTDWNMTGLFLNNRCGGIYNNFCSEITNNNCSGGIYGNGPNVTVINNNIAISVFNNNISGSISRNIVSENIWNNDNNGDIIYNTCTSIFSNGSSVAMISYNMVTGQIGENNNLGGIVHNRCSGNISWNSNEGNISDNCNDGVNDNSNSGDIINNSNTGSIYGNSNSGSIASNSNAGDISNNLTGVSSIHENSNAGSISANIGAMSIAQNANSGRIYNNNSSGHIYCNANGGEIENNICDAICYNSNSKSIDNCEIVGGYILNNKNNGVIRVNSTTTRNVFDNTNNGDIQGTIITDITDTRVNKP